MAHRGPMARTVKHGRTPNADWTVVPDKPYVGRSPDLPASPGGRRRWHPSVLGWWAVVRKMPHCRLWTDTDWLFAVETAYMKQAYWQDYQAGALKTTMATEIRRREDQMGTTVEARRKLRIRYAKEEPVAGAMPAELVEDLEQDLEQSAAANVTSIQSRRKRLTG